MPVVEHWIGQDASVAEIERQLGHMRATMLADERRQPNQRTSVMTHVAWVPPEWLAAAEEVLEGLEERHPSRTVVLIPMADDGPGLEVELSVRCFTAGDRAVASEVIRLRLRGARIASPASLVLPLALSDLPLFVRWRGEPPFGEENWNELVKIADRVVVDSSEWSSLRYDALAQSFDNAAVSDIEWARTFDWRATLAGCWPGIREQEIRIRGPRGQATLLRGWLKSRLQRAIRPVELADELGVRLGGEELRPPLEPELSPSDLLSAELDRFGRDRVYEHAVLAAVL
jgi:glucose-6-phosphate dehydrogenase assembly protein OpcA